MSQELINTIRNKAKQNPKRIVLPEGEDTRILSAASYVSKEGICQPIIFGNPKSINIQANKLNLDISNIEIIDLKTFDQLDELTILLQDIYSKKNKHLSQEQLDTFMANPLYIATLLVKNGNADGCVAGAIYTTAEVLKAGFSILGTQSEIKTISGAFIMIVKEQLFVFADCAVVTEPSSEQLADIAIASAKTARELLGLDVKVAMLSFSTHGSANHSSSEKVIQATKLVKQKSPELLVDGELQLDAAICQKTAIKKAPNSEVSGKANVLIFPNLDAGNIGYKLVQELANAQAIGPILQGISKPMNDLSRGATVEDIINTIAITAVQSQ